MITFCGRRDLRREIYDLHGHCAERTNLKIFPAVWSECDGSKRQLPARLPGRPETTRPSCLALYASASRFIASRESATRFGEFRFAYDEPYNYLLLKKCLILVMIDKCAVQNNTVEDDRQFVSIVSFAKQSPFFKGENLE